MKISPATTLAGLGQLAEVKRYWIAYSGGLDSHVLLHAMVNEREMLSGASLTAIHINHGLSPNAKKWAEHCMQQCTALGIPLHQETVDAQPQPGESPEAAARNARYQAFARVIRQGDCLLTAHHQEDQAETLLLQLLRGAGPQGLAAMPLCASFVSAWHVRPLLGARRDALQAYAKQHSLTWIDDESNFDTGIDRNYLRHEIMPRLKSRFPAAAETLSRSAKLCAEAAQLLNVRATEDLAALIQDNRTLSISRLSGLGEVRGRNALHRWIRDSGLPIPSAAQMQHIWQDIINASIDSCPVVSWPGAEARRYRDSLFIAAPLPPFDAARQYRWSPDNHLEIEGLGVLAASAEQGMGISPKYLNGQAIEIRFRQGGESLQPVGRAGHHAVKKLFQEAGVPSWQRERIPLLFIQNQLAAVAGYWIAQAFAAAENETGLVPVWLPHQGSRQAD